MGGQNKQGGRRFFVKFNKQGGQNKRGWGGVGILKNPLILVMNKKRDINV